MIKCYLLRSIKTVGLVLVLGATVAAQPLTVQRPVETYYNAGSYAYDPTGLVTPFQQNQLGVVAEQITYTDGTFKVALQNLNDPKTAEGINQAKQLLNNASQTIRSESASADERAEAKKLMTQYLQVQFDHDQKKREEQLKSLEAQVVKMKAQLEKRTQNKDELISLRIKLWENDASGLSFPQSWNQMPPAHDPYSQPGFPGGASINSYSGQPGIPANSMNYPGANRYSNGYQTRVNINEVRGDTSSTTIPTTSTDAGGEAKGRIKSTKNQ